MNPGYLRTKIFTSDNLCVLYNVMPWNISFPGWCVPVFYRLYQKNFSFCQPWWWPLVNPSLISESQENDSSFDFLNNALMISVFFCSCIESAHLLTFLPTLSKKHYKNFLNKKIKKKIKIKTYKLHMVFICCFVFLDYIFLIK